MEENNKTIEITALEDKMLKEIIEAEIDGVGRGYSEFKINSKMANQEKGVLSSLIQKGLVYDSYDNDEDLGQMWCTTSLRDNVKVKNK